MKKRFLTILMVITFVSSVFAAGVWNPKDTLNTPLSGQTWSCVEVWNGGTCTVRATDATVKVVSWFSSAGMFASKENSTGWLIYIIEGTIDGKRQRRNVIDSDATQINFW